ncbi:ABC transporter ATP-binding protein [Corynebacterium guaraldiae]|uniref:ABC transporter ATP-binding protein n=1 Tax=Corynebacterium hesseae TaxID=2913502 RepID=A0ABU9UII8_9CORY|nr:MULTISPECIES: ABC transporter ATP-binding protein [Corynebacterium]MCG7260010.1 ABC transporter ATP-binding protein [Corynebacterium aurimucosum]MCZ9298286.1 ABC transporter ATP-binding protein [Corynebacterium hesseae]MDK6806771.1 ABC transporter ATP-binding protein [Corynebacterium aurimucosum]MDK8898836.1 ABC transporter ATP-binding protein [Corynebacterium sp. MSK004]NJJ83329.1 ABC transporter ATP-binding protein [Corynebacterium aurimucosum]
MTPDSVPTTQHIPFPLELENITCIFGSGARQVTALDSVNLQLQPGELVAVMGPSGSGKSTLLNVAGLLQPPTSGRVLLDGADASQLSKAKAAIARRRHLGLVFQHFNLVSSLTVGENVSLPLELDGLSPAQCREAAEEALSEVGLDGTIDRFPEEISGGQAQRVAIARALIGPRKVLLADEPTGALDTSTGEEIMKVLRARIDAGASGILVTHEPRFAGWADRVVMVRDGRLTGEEVR